LSGAAQIVVLDAARDLRGGRLMEGAGEWAAILINTDQVASAQHPHEPH